MIIEVPWHIGAITVGWNEPAIGSFVTDTWLVDSLGAPRVGSNELRRIWIEAIRNTGPRTVFGMLAAERRPLASESVIRVPVLGDGNQYVAHDPSKHQAIASMPADFAQAVMAGAKRALDRTRSQEIAFGFAAHTELGSSTGMFERLAWVATTLLSEDLETDSIVARVTSVVRGEFA